MTDGRIDPDKLDVLLNKENTWKAWVVSELMSLRDDIDELKHSNERMFQLILALLGLLVTVFLTILGWLFHN